MPAERPWTPWHDRLHRALLASPELLPEATGLIVAVSGGQDSMALLALLQDLQRLHDWQLMVWHGDHGWHDESQLIAKALRDWCDERQQPITISQANRDSTRSEASARQWRYAELQQLANQHGCDVVTGHTASDRAETLLLQMARGCDLKGLGSLRAQRPLDQNQADGPQLRRPLLGFCREETLSICQELDLPIWIDPSNASKAFARNRIRHDVLPVLEELHPGSSQRIADLAERSSYWEETQRELSGIVLKTITQGDGLDRQSMAALSDTTRRSILHQWLLGKAVPNITAMLICELSHRLQAGAPAGATNLPGGWVVRWNNKSVSLDQKGTDSEDSRAQERVHHRGS